MGATYLWAVHGGAREGRAPAPCYSRCEDPPLRAPPVGHRRPVVLLYQPRVDFYTLPLALLALGSALDGVEVRVLDGRLSPELPRLDGPVLALGVSVLSGAPITDAIRFSQAFRAAHPGVPVVWGGFHPSIFPEQCVAHPAVDVAVVGQGQLTFAELVARRRAGAPLAGLAGAWVREDGIVTPGPERAMASPASFPPTDYGLLDLEPYFQRSGRRALDYVSSQGCPYRCSFCSDPMVYGRSWLALPAERVLAEIEQLAARYRLDEVLFQDDLFFVNRGRANAILEGLARLARPLRWIATARAAHIARMSPDELQLLKRSGCRRIVVGAESGTDTTLDLLEKDQRAEDLLRCAERLGALGLPATFSFIAGTPGETPADLEATLRRILEICRLNPLTDTPIFRFTPYPGNALVQGLARDGVPLPTTLEGWATCDLLSSQVAVLTPAQRARIARFEQYVRYAYKPTGNPARAALARLARARLEHDRLEIPVELELLRGLRSLRSRLRPEPSRPWSAR